MSEVQAEFLDYYIDLLGSKAPVLPIDVRVIQNGPLLNEEQGLDLCRPGSDQHIRDAIFSIPAAKSPGPDGFSFGFF